MREILADCGRIRTRWLPMRTRLLAIFVLAILGSSACDDRTTNGAQESAGADAWTSADEAAAIERDRRWEQERTALGLVVSVRDRATGRPLEGFGIGEIGRDVTGVDGMLETRRPLPEPSERITVHCPSRLGFKGMRIADAPFAIRDGIASAEFEVDPSVCREPPTTQRRGRFAGMYLSTFEQSAFFPCEGLPGVEYYARGPHSAWANLPASLEDSLIWQLRMHVADDGVYVEWTGTLTGPGPHGHLGASLYNLDAETVHEVSSTRPAACRAPGFKEALDERERYRRMQETG
jgi:hypothetical protein